MLLSAINPVLAAPGDKSANLTWEQEIQQFREYLGQSQSPLTTNEEVREFRTTYWDHLFPEYSRKLSGRDPLQMVFNNESPLNYDIMYTASQF